MHEVPSFNARVVDLTGAGDVFCAGFLCEYIKTKHPSKSVFFGCAVSSLVIERTGGVLKSRMPTLEEVRKRMNQKQKRIQAC